MANSWTKILRHVSVERHKQIAKWGIQRHKPGTSLDYLATADRCKLINDSKDANGEDPTWMDILFEEVYEAASADNADDYRAELVQVAAVAVAAIEDLDRRREQIKWTP